MTGPGTSPGSRVALILAAGQGTRMRSELPKVLHPVAGRPMLAWVLEAARQAGCAAIYVVVGHGAEAVRQAFPQEDLHWVLQAEQLGTGHAVLQAEGEIPAAAQVLILSGDVPLVRLKTLETLAQEADRGWGAMAVAELADPSRLGRVLVDSQGRLERIVEAADATAAELAVRCINAGLYALPAGRLFELLHEAGADNAQGEIYLTEALNRAAQAGHSVRLVHLEDPSEAWGVNTRQQLAQAHRRLVDRTLERLQEEGVTVLEPARTVVEPGVEVGRDSILHPASALLGSTRVGAGCIIHQGAWLRNSVLGDGVVVEPYTVMDGAQVGEGVKVGPFARLRPGAVLDRDVRVGNFVEVKNTHLHAGAKAGHLAYLGDSTVGAGANIGAGVVTCNYDGERKHRTEIGAGAFVGSDTMLVAPVTVGEGATTGAGSVITQDVPPGDLGVARSRQRNIPDWAERQGRAKNRDQRDSNKKD
jgi:bifunctional UDP-N-acetylglucosamine pyrophosphorylase/glucosamine-1-phosphate N-acetyltransferase